MSPVCEEYMPLWKYENNNNNNHFVVAQKNEEKTLILRQIEDTITHTQEWIKNVHHLRVVCAPADCSAIATALNCCNKKTRALAISNTSDTDDMFSEIVTIFIIFFLHRFATYVWQKNFRNEIIWLFLSSLSISLYLCFFVYARKADVALSPLIPFVRFYFHFFLLCYFVPLSLYFIESFIFRRLSNKKQGQKGT